MEIKEAEKIIDDMYQDRMNTRIEKIEKGTVIHAEKEVTFTKLEEASVLLLREELSLKRKIEEQEKIIELMAEKIYSTSDTLNMLSIGKAVNYDLEKILNGIDDKEAIKIIIDYFKKKARDENG